MPCAFVGHGVVSLARGLHLRDRIGDHGANARIVPRVKAVDRRLNAHHRILVRRRAIENESSRQIRTIRCKAEGLAAAPAKTADEELAVRGGNLQRVIRRGIQIRGYLVWIQVTYGFHCFALRKIAATAAVRAHAG